MNKIPYALRVGMCFCDGKRILEVIPLSNGWFLVKTENHKSPKDFKVRAVYRVSPKIQYYTPKHAHFAIDLYGKYCANKEKAKKVFKAIIEVWQNKPIEDVLRKYGDEVKDLPGYPLEYILYALKWIFEQEDINFKGRPNKLQQELDRTLKKLNITFPPKRKGSELAVYLLCNIILGMHPVEALLKANLDIKPRFKR